MTQDLDFADIRRFLPGTHWGILLVRLKNPSRSALIQRSSQVLAMPESQEWSKCFVIATESKIRVRWP